MTSTDTINAHIARSRELESGPVKVLTGQAMRKARQESARQASQMTKEHMDDHMEVRRLQEEMRGYREALSVAVEALEEIHHPSEPKGRHERIAEEALSKIAAILSPP